MTRARSYDVVIVGARCAGAATALLLARRGLRVLVIDRDQYGTDTVSTHALMRTAVVQLARWGLLDDVIAAGTPAIRTATYHYGDERIAFPIKPRDGTDALYAPRRTVLDPILVEAACEAGAEVRFGVRLVELLTAPDGRVTGVVVRRDGAADEPIRARLVIGADGIASATARLAGAAVTYAGTVATAALYVHARGIADDGYHWYYRPGTSAGVIPTNEGGACVFVLVPPRRYRDELRHDVAGGFRRVLAEAAPELAEVVDPLRSTPVRPFAGRPTRVRQAWGPGWALVGDAGYFRDPITAHGISDALRDAELLARAAVLDTALAYADYEATRDELSREMIELTERIASFAWEPAELAPLHRRLAGTIHRELACLTKDDAPPTAAPMRTPRRRPGASPSLARSVREAPGS